MKNAKPTSRRITFVGPYFIVKDMNRISLPPHDDIEPCNAVEVGLKFSF